ncbi:hypothetical protein GCM10009745_23890 [Kribbella yunnanensis]|uniref:FtsX-like permease family protein n=1 Tax=Kribbella yunnanensis TaxID=190194 RepID=A0ABP4SYJ8_9ACTN
MSLSLSTTLLLARSRTPADRSRVRLATAALSFSGALLINAVHIGSLGRGELSKDHYSNYVAESGLRPGLTAALAILAVLAGALSVQALRLGTAARERRFAALQLAGASSRQVRRLSTADATLIGLSGGLLSGPLYAILTVLFSGLPRVTQVFPGLSSSDLLVWVAVAVALPLGGAAMGYLTYRDPSASRPASGFPAPLAVIAGLVCLVLAVLTAAGFGFFTSPLILIGLAVVWATQIPRSVGPIGRWLARSGQAGRLLAGARIVADARSAARMGGLLLGCAFLVGALVHEGLVTITGKNDPDSLGFYVAGFGMSALGLALLTGIALASLTVGVADQLVEQRRQLACLTALGVDGRFLHRVVRDQISLVATPALMIGSCVGLLMGPQGLIGFQVDLPSLPFLAVGLAGLLLLSWGFAVGGAALAGYLLRNQLRDALDPENLRAA